jgi:thioredoxin 1
MENLNQNTLMSLQRIELHRIHPVGMKPDAGVVQLGTTREREKLEASHERARQIIRDRDMKTIPEINEPDFEAEVLKPSQPVLVNFLAAWSQPCRILGPVLDEVAGECNGRAKVVKVNVELNPHLAMWYGIQSIPTLLCFVDGEVRAKIVGTASKRAILSKLGPFLPRVSVENPSTSQDDFQLPETERMNAIISERASNAQAPRLPPGRSLHHVNFFCEASEASHVFLVGDFNHWDPVATPMNRMPDGRWEAGLELFPGHHQYLFLVDGKSKLDPTATGVTRNDRNERVSLIAVG